MAKQRDPWLETRATLLVRLRNLEDQSSWQQFFDRYWKLIYGVARKTGLSDEEAQDVVQETLASVAKDMPGFKYDPKIGSFKAWLCIKARWRAIEQFRKRMPVADLPRRGHDDTTIMGGVDKLVDPASQEFDALWESEWKNNLLQAATIAVKHKADPQQYQIFDCYVNREWSPEKVAEKFDVSVKNVYVIKHRVTAMLKKEIGRLEKQVV